MKNFMRLIYMIILSCIIPGQLFSQTIDPNGPVPLDPEVRFGELENGLTYYIKKNQKPEQRAEFYLVNDVGAILETDAQNGLAHFCEHMCFNGTEHFPDKGILNYFETVGMEFGRNINAGTGVDQTLYLLMQTPVTREGIIDTALLALKDFSHYVSFEASEIDAERGVIHEEWRTSKTANDRLFNKIDPIKYKGSQYAKRDVIGDIDVIDNFEYETLRSFYRDWYRTDLQALVIVGDIDVDQIEAKVKEIFSEIPKQENPKERIIYDVPDNKEPLVAIATDKEAQNSNVMVYYKHDYVLPEDKNMQFYIEGIKVGLYSNMLNERFNELVQNENPPFIFGYNYYGSFAGNKSAYALGASPNENILYGLETLLTESERVRQHGFTPGELNRAKTSMLRGLEKRYKEKDQQQNRNVAFGFVGHFLNNSPTPGIENEFLFAQQILPAITLEDVNGLASKWVREENRVVTITGPEKEGLVMPTEEEVLALMEKVKASKIEAYVDKVSDKPLIENIPAPGKIVNESTNEALGTTEWVLSNGVKVVFKPTDFKDDEILFTSFSPGGTSLYNVTDLASAEFATLIVNRSGIADFSLVELEKMLTGKVVSVNPYINDLYEGISGNASPVDFETALQLINLYFANPRFDETAANAYFARFKAFLQNKALNPNAVFNDSVTFILADRHPREIPLNVDKLNLINFEKATEIYKERFADASDFTFIFTGNIDIEKTKPLILSYLGSLPSVERQENWKDNNVRYPKGKSVNIIEKDLEIPKNSIYVNFNGEFDYNYKNRILLQTIKHVLDIRYTATIREDEGGTYGVGIWATTSQFPTKTYTLNMNFDCAPEKADQLKAIIYEEIDKMVNEGPSLENLNKAKENFIKNRENSLKENRFWMNSIVHNYKHDENILDNAMYKSMVESITIEDVKQAAKTLLTQGNEIEVIMTPTE